MKDYNTIIFVAVVFSQAARAQGVDCIVAPYEADAQLAYLNKTGIVQAIITEDSDLLAFGCKKVEKICFIAKRSQTRTQMYLKVQLPNIVWLNAGRVF